MNIDKNFCKNRPNLRSIDIIILFCLFAFFVSLIINNSKNATTFESGDPQKREQAIAQLKVLSQAVKSYAKKNNKLPDSFSELVPEQLAEIPQDPYGNPYKLFPNGKNATFIGFLGKNGKIKGASDQDVDIMVYIEID